MRWNGIQPKFIGVTKRYIGVKAIIVDGRTGSCARNTRMMGSIACLQLLFFPRVFSKIIVVVEGCWEWVTIWLKEQRLVGDGGRERVFVVVLWCLGQ